MTNRNATTASRSGCASGYRANLMAAVSLVTLVTAASGIIGAGSARAADAAGQTAQATPQTSQAPQVEEIVVTGSRIIRDGYEAPTPVSVLSADELKLGGEGNITDAIVKMPAFSGSLLASGSQVQSDSTGTAGFSILNLRQIGTNRTLVLFDGKRMVGSTLQGTADTALIPDMLVSRLDVVTGGTSAVYGSDAVSGAVNFVLDKEYTGLKGSVEGGMTEYSDKRNYKVTLAAGTTFANGRGHLLLSGQDMYDAGIKGCSNARTWCKNAYDQTVQNPAYVAGNGQPQYLAVLNAGFSTAAPGGLITAGPLRWTYFGPGGVPGTLNFGTVAAGVIIGGDWQNTRIDQPGLGLFQDLAFSQKRRTAFARVSYDVTDRVNVYSEFQWGQTRVRDQNAASWNLGNLTVRDGNPFIPAIVQAQMTAQKLTSFALGTFNVDTGPLKIDNGAVFRRYMVGASGDADAFDTNWKWNAYAQISNIHIGAKDWAVNTPNLNRAIDAVRSPTTGNIVCRSTLTNPSDGCVPYNVMGIGVNSQQAVNYVAGWGVGSQRFIQKVADVDATGEPFSTWAGPVSVAFGMTYRSESGDGVQDPVGNTNAKFVGNYHDTVGHYDVTEGFVETVVPLAKDTVWAKSLDLNGAVRATSYSTSGYVTTWKIGASWQVIDDLRFRATQSRDIRAPNLGDLFSAGSTGASIVFDPAKNGAAVSVQSSTVGNPALLPEKANQTGVGVVLQPAFFPGFSASVDYYHIRINDAIGSSGTQQSIVDACYNQKVPQICALLTRDAGGNLVFIQRAPVNINYEIHSGIDLEASYSTPLSAVNDSWDGSFGVRFLGTVYLHHIAEALGAGGVQQIFDGAGVNTDGALGIGYTGTGDVPRFRYSVKATYTNNPFTVALTARGFGAGVNNPNAIECSSGCPVTTAPQFTVNTNHSPGQLLFDLAFSYKFLDDKLEAFLSVENLMNRNPPYIPNSVTQGPYYRGIWEFDTFGRQFHAGVRFKL